MLQFVASFYTLFYRAYQETICPSGQGLTASSIFACISAEMAGFCGAEKRSARAFFLAISSADRPPFPPSVLFLRFLDLLVSLEPTFCVLRNERPSSSLQSSSSEPSSEPSASEPELELLDPPLSSGGSKPGRRDSPRRGKNDGPQPNLLYELRDGVVLQGERP